MFTGLKDGVSKDNISDFVLLDFGGKFIELKPSFKYYQDLSPKGDHLEAINVLYDLLRWAETLQDAKLVLITNFFELEKTASIGQNIHFEHREALFDRVFRATSGKEF